MAQPLVHVLIINWNGLEHLEACYDSLIASDYERIEFVLVDNASEDGSMEFVQDRYGADPRVTFCECGGNLGWSRGNNVGIRRALDAGADYIFLLNNDTATDARAIERLVEVAEDDSGIGALAPKMVLFDQPHILNSVGMECSIIGSCWDRGLGRVDREFWDESIPVAGACGGAAFFRAEAIRKSGLLPEDFEIYLDDLDLCLRLWAAGYRIQTCPAAVVQHKFSATMGTGARARHKYYLNTRNRFRVAARNWPKGVAGATIMAMIRGEMRAVGRSIIDGDMWKVGAHAQSWAAAIRELSSRNGEAFPTTEDCPFWPHVLEEPLFFPGVPLPEAGWYPETTVGGQRVQPISTRAEYRNPGGALRMNMVNCYPELGPVELRFMCGDACLSAHTVPENLETTLEAPEGTLHIEADQCFYAEDTGELTDFGGWLSIAPADESGLG